MKKRVIIIVLDSFGIGAAADADKFGDGSANTLASLIKTGELSIPNLENLGLGCIDGVFGLGKVKSPLASYGRMAEISRGKDTTIGHWEIAGIVSDEPLPTYPDGFPEEVIGKFEALCGRGTLCNKPYSGTDVIRDFGKEHLESGRLIVYTSADSVFQIAAHEDIVPLNELYGYCLSAREILTGKHAVGRVIARPFVGEPDNFTRTSGRRDFSLMPPKDSLLDALKAAGLDVISVGKIEDIFAGRGITEGHKTHSNAEGMKITSQILKRDFSGLLFLNLVDFDMLFGHRQDAVGYARALSEFDKWLGEFKCELGRDDLLIITADHGCDPSDNSTDHTREYVPLLVYDKSAPVLNFGTVSGFYKVAQITADALGVNFDIN